MQKASRCAWCNAQESFRQEKPAEALTARIDRLQVPTRATRHHSNNYTGNLQATCERWLGEGCNSVIDTFDKWHRPPSRTHLLPALPHTLQTNRMVLLNTADWLTLGLAGLYTGCLIAPTVPRPSAFKKLCAWHSRWRTLCSARQDKP